MLKLTTVGTVLATIFCTQINSSILTPVDAANQPLAANASNLVMLAAEFNSAANITNTEDTILIASSSNTPEALERIGPAGMLLGLAAVGSAIGLALSANNAKPLTSTRYGANSSFKGDASTIQIEHASRKLQKKLLRLLHDERDTANRLLSQVKIRNPYRSVDWCVEKVIYDLERDRGGY